MSSSTTSSVKMYCVLNSSVSMGKGKMCGQIGHAVSELVRKLEKNPTSEYKLWLTSGETKVILKAPEEELLQLLKNHPRITIHVRDLGKTQVKENTLTVVAFYPLLDVPAELKEMKLL